jgi:hypothetical protein
MSEEEMRERVMNEHDFVCAKRFDYSSKKVEERFPNGCPDHIIADILMVSEAQLQAEMDIIVGLLQVDIGVS